MVPDFGHAAAATRTCGGAGVAFDDLGTLREQSSGDHPDAPPLSEGLDPRAKMCGQGIVIECQAVARAHWSAARREPLRPLTIVPEAKRSGMHPLMGQRLCARTKGKRGDPRSVVRASQATHNQAASAAPHRCRRSSSS